MAHGSHLYVWPTDTHREALRKLSRETHSSGWLKLDGDRFSADALSREFETAVVRFELSTTTDSFLIELFIGGNSVRALEFSGDDGWSKRGKAAPFEAAARMKPWFAKRRILASPEGYEVLAAFLGSEPKAQPRLLAAIAAANELTIGHGWDFGGLERVLAKEREVGVRGLSECLALVSTGVGLWRSNAKPEQTIELARAPADGPVAWKDVGVFFALAISGKPFVPTPEQKRFLTDDAIDDLRRAHQQASATELMLFWPTRGLNAAVTRKRAPIRAPEESWKPWRELRDDLEGAPRGQWTKAGSHFERPLGDGVLRCETRLATRVWGAIDGLGKALEGRALGGDALEALALAWSGLGAHPLAFLPFLAEL